MNWKNISLAKFRQLDEISSRDIPELDKVLFSTCVVFNKTEYELDNADPKEVVRLTARMRKIFETPLNEQPLNRIGKYFINYHIQTITFGQYIELAFFLSHKPVQNAHYVLATLAHGWMRKNRTRDHRGKADYFLNRPVSEVMGSLKRITENLAAFNEEYKDLFGLDKMVAGDVQEDVFNKRYGWIYSASKVAEYERITLDEAFSLPIRQALNDLTYLKAKDKYEAEQIKKSSKSTV